MFLGQVIKSKKAPTSATTHNIYLIIPGFLLKVKSFQKIEGDFKVPLSFYHSGDMICLYVRELVCYLIYGLINHLQGGFGLVSDIADGGTVRSVGGAVRSVNVVGAGVGTFAVVGEDCCWELTVGDKIADARRFASVNTSIIWQSTLDLSE